MSIIIVSDVPPDSRYTAGQVLNQAITSLSDYNFRFYWFNQSNLNTEVNLPSNCNIIAVVSLSYGRVLKFLVRICNFLLRQVPLFAKLVFLVKAALVLASLIATSVKLGFMVRRDPSRLVWFVVQGDRPVIAYSIISWISRKPYLLQQWDPLSWWMGHRHYPRRIIRITHSILGCMEKGALVNIVPSDAWKEQLEAQGKSAIRLDNFIRQELLDESGFLSVRDPRALHAVFVGQFYADHELALLVEVLHSALQSSGLKLVIHLFGSGAPVYFAGSEIIFHGYMERDELIRRISKWDLALLPYPMVERYEETARLSFPSKARIYLAAGLPILACAPTFSGVHRFLEKHYLSHYCNIEIKKDIQAFVFELLDCSYAARKLRYLNARGLVSKEFSDTAELLPLRNLLRDSV